MIILVFRLNEQIIKWSNKKNFPKHCWLFSSIVVSIYRYECTRLYSHFRCCCFFLAFEKNSSRTESFLSYQSRYYRTENTHLRKSNQSSLRTYFTYSLFKSSSTAFNHRSMRCTIEQWSDRIFRNSNQTNLWYRCNDYWTAKFCIEKSYGTIGSSENCSSIIVECMSIERNNEMIRFWWI